MATRSRPSWRSASRLRIELLLALVAIGCGGDGGGEECGPGDEPTGGVALDRVTFDDFHSSANNDCTPAGGGPTSLTVQGAQVDPADPARFLVLCLPRPDRIEGAAIPLTDEDRVQLIDLTATDPDGCRLDLDRSRLQEGTITFSGFCADGTDPAGYAIGFTAAVPLLRSCDGGEAEPIEAELGGRAAVQAD
jgi:hypothetical protein